MKNPFSLFTARRSTRSRGFALLFAALIASVVLSLGAAIFDISIKQVELSSASRESQYAFYAADTAANCALYWDERFNEFATVTPALNPAPNCDGQSLTITPQYSGGSPANYPYTQSFEFTPNNYCAQVTVTKSETLGTGGVEIVHTVLQANGYDTTCSGLNGQETLQRTIELNY